MSKKENGQKRRKNKATRKKPLTEYAYFRTLPNTSRIDLTINPMNGMATLNGGAKSAYSEVSRERDNPYKPEKSVNRVFSVDDQLAIDVAAAMKQFEISVAIDTNTKMVDGKRRSVAGIAVSDGEVWGTPYCIELVDAPVGKEERTGWIEVLNQLCQDGFLRPGQPTAVIVDAHLGDLEAINLREQALLGDMMLPQPWVINYASADTGAQFEPNRLIRLADRAAKKVIDHLFTRESALPQETSPSYGGAKRRIILFSNSFYSWKELRSRFQR